MRNLQTLVFLLLLALGSATCSSGQSGEGMYLPPPHYRFLVQMGECKTLDCLKALRSRIPSTERTADIVYFSQQMLLRPSKNAAAGLLNAIPSTSAEQNLFINFSGWHDGETESMHDMEVLGRIYERWPKLVTKAVLLRPDMMVQYVRFLRLAPNDIHSDFTGKAEKVCEKNRAAFGAAFALLPQEEQKYIRKYVFEPSSCKAIFLSESE
jgi:hypothetical protein